MRGGIFFYNFPMKSPFILETIRDRPVIAVKHEQEVIGRRSIRVGSDDRE